MKGFAWILGLTLLAVTLIATGCAKPAAPPAPAPAAEQPKVSVTEGTLGGVDTQKSTVTVETPQGPRAFPIGPQTALTFEGKACTLDQLAELEASGENFDCTVVYDEEGNVAALNVYRISPPASVRGSISDVNIKESTITVKTASGDVIYQVDPDTGLIMGGTVCSLAMIDALIEAGGEIPCTVIYSTDNEGKALYIDMASPPDLTLGTGTIKEVNIEKKTVTITTDKGDRTFEVDAKTGQFLNGEVCSLEDILDATEHGDTLQSCQVMYYTDKDGKLIYLDISHTVNP